MKRMKVLGALWALVAAVALVGCGSTSFGLLKPSTASVAPTSNGVSVLIANFAFEPSTVTVTAGQTVTWTNRDGVPHDATGAGWTSGSISSGQSYTKLFDKPGTYPYRCQVHPAMPGATVTVK
jgi:plastocyanin